MEEHSKDFRDPYAFGLFEVDLMPVIHTVNESDLQ